MPCVELKFLRYDREFAAGVKEQFCKAISTAEAEAEAGSPDNQIIPQTDAKAIERQEVPPRDPESTGVFVEGETNNQEQNERSKRRKRPRTEGL
jgi:hypothetical protein